VFDAVGGYPGAIYRDGKAVAAFFDELWDATRHARGQRHDAVSHAFHQGQRQPLPIAEQELDVAVP
jgi:hypothetical protein